MDREKRFGSGITCHVTKIEKCEENCLMATLALQVGAADDGSLKGIAHFLEHMTLSFDRFGNTQTGYFTVQGVTTNYCTQYKIKSNSSEAALKNSLDIFSNILSGYYLDDTYLEFVREDVLREFSTFEIEKFKKVRRLKRDSCVDFPIGRKKDIEKLGFEDIIRFFKEYYKSRAIMIAIVGDIPDVDKVLSLCEKYFDITDEQQRSEFKRESIIYKDRRDYIFHKSENCIEYYISRKRLPTNIKERCIEDIGFLIIENFFPNVSGININTIVECKNVIYTYNSYYTRLTIQADTKLNLNKNNIRRNIAFSLQKGISSKLSEIIKEYNKYLSSLYTIGIEDYTEEIMEHFFWGKPIFELDKYVWSLNKIRDVEIYETFSDIFFL